jgi:hypothetical protein
MRALKNPSSVFLLAVVLVGVCHSLERARCLEARMVVKRGPDGGAVWLAYRQCAHGALKTAARQLQGCGLATPITTMAVTTALDFHVNIHHPTTLASSCGVLGSLY